MKACRSFFLSLVAFALVSCGGMGENAPENRDDSDEDESVPTAVGGYTAQPAQVYIDGKGADWTALSARHEDAGDGDNLRLEQLWVAHTERRLFLRLAVASPINLEENNDLTLYLDADNNPTTGTSALGLGAEVEWTFGARRGELADGTDLEHEDVGLASLPTVREDTFEIAFSRSALSKQGLAVAPGDSLRIALASDGDRLPDDDGGLGYVLSDTDASVDAPSLARPSGADLRLMSYNVPNNFDRSRNRLFNTDRQPSYRRILQAVAPDVLALQEMYDNTADDVEQELEGPIDGVPKSWNWAKTGGELVLGSAYPIRDTTTIQGAQGQPSGGYLLDTRDALGTRLVVVVMHPKCCGGTSEDRSRQATVDGVVAFLRDLRRGEAPFTVPDETPIVVMGDMNFVGDPQQPRTLRTGQIINTNEFGDPAAPDWNGSPLLDTNPQQIGSPLHTTTFSTGSSFPPGRLDYAYVTDSVLDVVHEFLLSTPSLSADQRTEYGLDVDDTTVASDHLPVVIDISQ